jgi:anti-sigma factor RsiW
MPNIFFACESYEADLSALIDGELSTPRAAEVGEHLSACAGCSRYFAALSGVDRVLAATAMPEVPAGLRLRLQEQIESIPEREEAARERHAAPRARRRLIRSAIGAAFALAASAVVYLAVVSEPTVDTGSEAPVAAVVEEAQLALVREPSGEEAASDEAVALEESVAVVDGASELEAASDEELGVLLELEVIQDLDVIANLEMLEQLMLVGEGAS